MKVLFTGPYRQNDGWGRSSQDYLTALQLIDDIELEAKPMILSNQVDKDSAANWLDLEQVDIGKPDVIIHHAPPFMIKPVQDCYNISLAHYETYNLTQQYAGNLKNVQEVWVSTQQEMGAVKPFNSNVHRIPMPIDLDFIDNHTDKMETEMTKDKFLFMYSGSWNERKNLSSLILAYWLEFRQEENVRLFMKMNNDGGRLTADAFMKWVNDLKRVSRLYSKPTEYPDILTVVGFHSNEDMVKIQRRADCFVVSSYGESTCRPLLETMYMGVPCICTSNIGANEPHLNLISVDSTLVPCQVNTPPIPFIYTSRELWWKIDILDLAKNMRLVYKNGKNTIMNSQKEIKDEHSYTAVAGVINDALRRVFVSV